MYNLVPDYTIVKLARELPPRLWPARVHIRKEEEETEPLFTESDKRELAVWDANVQPDTMLPDDFIEGDGIAKLTLRDNHTRVFDWYSRRCEFIAARKKANAALRAKNSHLDIPVEIKITPTQRNWDCTACSARAVKQISLFDNKRHNPAGPAVVKTCRCGYMVSKWYEHGVLYKCEIKRE